MREEGPVPVAADVPVVADPSRRMFPPFRRICVVGRADATAPTLLYIRILKMHNEIHRKAKNGFIFIYNTKQ
ncbi:MAG: hypothetical protein IKJ81_10160 [Bacteroidales bacterium]|nr:hypothetical protein [Bacteroidales bacterium]